jgi:hypothetical protein
MSDLTSTDYLRLAQQSTGRRQKAYLSILQLAMLLESGDNLRPEQQTAIDNVILELLNSVPEARKAK